MTDKNKERKRKKKKKKKITVEIVATNVVADPSCQNVHHKQIGFENVNFLSADFSSSFCLHSLLFWLKLPTPNTAAVRLHISVQG